MRGFISRVLRLYMIAYIILKQSLQRNPRGVNIRKALETLGPIFVKFGQLLSTRVDSIPDDIIRELSLLQDKVPPFPSKTAKQLIEHAFQKPLEHTFKSFDAIPLASASIAQVHRATLFDGQSMVVKILRPNVHRLIKRDVELLKSLARWAKRYWKGARQFKPCEIVAEFEKALADELDLMREAASASELRRNFANSSLLYIPKMYWPLCTKNVLVMEEIEGIPISQKERLIEMGFDLKCVAERNIEIFFTQVFRDSFFHADMHPGNLFVSTHNIQNPMIIAVDFGIMGSLSGSDQRYIAENFLAFFNRNYRRVAELHLESGWIPKTVRIEEFEAAIRTLCEPMFERPLKEISFGQLLFQLFQTAKKYHINIQPQLILLQKTLMTVEGLSRQLYPELDLWSTAKPFLETWVKKQMGFSSFLRKFKEEGSHWLEKLPDMPNLLYAALSHSKNLSSFNSESTISNQNTMVTSKKDIILGILLGISLTLIVLMVLMTRSYFG